MPDRILPSGNESVRKALAGDKVAALHVAVSEHLEQIAKLFRPEMDIKLTFVARAPRHPDGSRDCVVTNDRIASAVAALRLKDDERGPAQPSAGAGRLNDVPVSPEVARLIVYSCLFTIARRLGDDERARACEAGLLMATREVDPFGPWDRVFEELKRIAGVECF